MIPTLKRLMPIRSSKFFFALTALLTGISLLVALFAQHILDMPPCAWCILQRVIFLIIFVLSCFGLWVQCSRTPVLLLTLAFGIAGVAAAYHQTTVASASFSCDMTLADRLITGSGLDSLVPGFFGVYANCFEANVDFLGVPFSGWALILFSAITLMGLWIWPVRNRSPQSQD